jgi:hypothetical protein
MVRGPAIARTQEWAFLQYWDGQDWKDLDAQLFGQETSTVRYSYIFDPVTTTRVRLSFTEPPDPEFRRTPDRLGIYVSEFEVYCDAPFQRVTPPQRLVPLSRDAPAYFNEPANGDARFDLAHPLIIEPKQTRIFEDTYADACCFGKPLRTRTRGCLGAASRAGPASERVSEPCAFYTGRIARDRAGQSGDWRERCDVPLAGLPSSHSEGEFAPNGLPRLKVNSSVRMIRRHE